MRSAVSELRRPEHTGENRCWPCTIANLLLLGAGCLVLAPLAPAASAFAAVAGVAVIWVRGYLVPYTPVFAPRLAARLPWNPFHGERGGQAPEGDRRPGSLADAGREGEPSTDGGQRDGDRDSRGTERGSGDRSADDGEAVLGTLVRAGVLRSTGDDVTLDDGFEERWQREMRALAAVSSDELAAAASDASPAAAGAKAVTERDRTYVVLSDGSGEPAGETWLRRPVAIAETAAVRALGDVGIEPGARAEAAHGLGVFLETCPVCDATLVERPAGGCCGPPRTDAEGRSLRALVCEECQAEFAVFD